MVKEYKKERYLLFRFFFFLSFLEYKKERYLLFRFFFFLFFFFFFICKRETSIKTKLQAHLFYRPHKLREEENTHYNKNKRLEKQ